MIINVLILLLGFGILIKGADWLVDGSSALARKYRIPELAIGLTIVAFGTSMPEFVVNSFAAYKSYSDIVFGNIIGSNIFNLFAILGVAGLITPISVQSVTVWKEIPMSLFAALLLFLLANSFVSDSQFLSRIDGIILLFFFCLFLLFCCGKGYLSGFFLYFSFCLTFYFWYVHFLHILVSLLQQLLHLS